jgi:DNA gyrase subunit B
MYVGDVAHGGLEHLVFEVIGNVVDLHLARTATELHVDIAADSWVTVRDDGPGISAEPFRDEMKTVLETIFTSLHSTPTRDGHVPHVHVGIDMRGVGLAMVTALSSRLEVATTRNGTRYIQAFERGVAATALHAAASSIAGTEIKFHPDPEIFPSIAFDEARLRTHLQELAWLNPLLRIFYQGQRLWARGGLRGWSENLATQPLAAYSTNQTAHGVFVDVALAWDASSETRIRSFVNMQETVSGTHVAGLWQGLTKSAAKLGARLRKIDDVRQALGPGLVAFIHVGLWDARFGGPTRDHLSSPEAARAVRDILAEDLPSSLAHAPQTRAFLETRLDFKQQLVRVGVRSH